jgi:hypothetical protein
LIKAGYVRLDGTDADLLDDDAVTGKKRKMNCYDGTDADLLDYDAVTGKKRKMNCYAGFTDAVGGGKTHRWAASTHRLDSGKWTIVLQGTIEKMDWSGDEGHMDCEEDHSGGAFGPRALIEIKRPLDIV